MNAQVEEVTPLKLDIGCGPNKRDGFVGIDCLPFDGKVDVVLDVGSEPLPYDAESVTEIHSSHFVEHLTSQQRIHFYNEIWRVLKKDGKAVIITPHWASNRAYGDPTHQWPPVSEMSFYYLSQEWRDKNAPHTDAKHWPQGYKCDLSATWGYSLHPGIQSRNGEYQQHALTFWKESAQDTHVTLTRK